VTRRTLVGVAALAAASALAACGQARPVEDSRPRACPDWVDGIEAALQQRCATCHAGATPAGGWDATTYLNAVSISPERFLAVLDASNETHGKLFTSRADDVAARDELRRWAADCSRRRELSRIHPNGIVDPFSADFHGAEVRRQAFDLTSCAGCHGSDFSGGTAMVSCRDCHADGPTACTGCHGQPPKTGAHLAHAAGALTGGRGLSCSECHTVPMVYTDAGHLLDDKGAAKTRATITFGAFAATTPKPAERSGAPAYDAETQSCANIYCHGAAFSDARAANTRPTWSGGAASSDCGSCHGNPPANHDAARVDCAVCHPRSSTGKSERHVDGLVSIGDETGTCTSCHPNPGGAHRSHTTAPRGLSRALVCQDCHIVPATVGAPGHLDAAPAEVFPTGWTPGLAASDGASPLYDGTRCTNVYCHGSGTKLGADQASGILRTPAWSDVGGPAAVCGGCHGVPPTTAPHTASMSLGACSTCHPSIDARGTLISPAAGGTHLDGVVDVR